MIRRPDYASLLDRAQEVISSPGRTDVRLKMICKLLASAIEYYNWVGFYLTEPGLPELVLGPYVGSPTDHIRIAFGQGICGQAADLKRTFLIDDVTLETNYLACSPLVRSEIVVPVVRANKVIGEIDIDSHLPSAFGEEDRRFLEELSGRVEPLL